jgi:subtilisin family serine protease
MRKFVFLAVVLAGLVLFSCQKEEVAQIEEQNALAVKSSSQIIDGKYIVVFKDEGLLKSATPGGKVSPEAVLQIARDIFSIVDLPMREPDFVYESAIRGIAVEMTQSEAGKIAKAPGVKGVYPDMMVTVGLPSVQGKPVPQPPSQSTPWGIGRVNGGVSYTGQNKAWIIDTGIDLDHPDLNVNTLLDKDFINGDDDADDDHGHGTHCAGIVAAINNTIGVIGVAAGATVVPVKVLDRRGSGAYSVIIAGVNYVAANAASGDVANMSLGGSVYTPIDDAVKALGNKIKVTLAAGNESDDANNHSPARAEGTNLYTISAMGTGDAWAYFSNYGNPPIEYCEPGVSIYSTYKGGAYATMSGTSMAAPHMCGLLLLGAVKTDGTVKGDPDGDPDPIAIH